MYIRKLAKQQLSNAIVSWEVRWLFKKMQAYLLWRRNNNNSLVSGTRPNKINSIDIIIIEPNPLNTFTPIINNKSAINQVLKLPSLIGARDLLHASIIASFSPIHFFCFSSRSLSNTSIVASTLIPTVKMIAANQLKEITYHINFSKPPR